MLGSMFAAIPQIYMNYHMLGNISINVPTGGLMLQQVFWGIQYQRYDTYIGKAPEHVAPQMFFQDPVGFRLLNELGINGFSGWNEFIVFCLKHPLEVFGIYVRHFVNMLFSCWPDQYVNDLNNCKVILAVLSLMMFFVFGIAILNKLVSFKFFKNYTALLTPILFIMPGAVEVRFFAALYIMVIGVLCYNTQWGKLWEYMLNNRVKVLVCFIIYSGLMLSIWSSMLASDPCCGIYF